MKSVIKLSAAFIAIAALSGNAFAQEDDGETVEQTIRAGCEARQEINDRVEQFWDEAEDVVCDPSRLDTANRYEESPYLWVSDDAQCDMNYSMPGLPDFSSGGSSSCDTLENITGDVMDRANQEFQGAVDDALESVGRERGEVDVNLDALARDVISNQ
jgi:hypothetical protein